MNVLETFYILFKANTDDVKRGKKEVAESLSDIEKGTKNTDKATKELGQSLAGIGSIIKNVASSFGEAEIARFFIDGIAKAERFNDALYKQSKVTGVSVNNLAVLGGAVASLGYSGDEARASITKLYNEYAAFGMSDRLKDLPATLKAINKNWHDLNLTSAQMQTQGLRMGFDQGMIELLKQTPEEFQKIIDKQKELNGETEKSGKAAREFGKSWDNLSATVTTAFSQAGEIVLPILTSFMDIITYLITAGNKLHAVFSEISTGFSNFARFRNVFTSAASPQKKSEAKGINSAEDAGNYLVSKGLSPNEAKGIVANLMRESNLSAGAVGDNGAAYGIAQWHKDRQKDFKSFSGKDIQGSSTQEQLDFILHELNNKEKKAGDALHGAASPADAGWLFSKLYERPANGDAEASLRAMAAAKLNLDMAGASSISAMSSGATLASANSPAGPQSNSVTVQTLNVHTQATDADGIAAAIGSSLNNHMRMTLNNWDDGRTS